MNKKVFKSIVILSISILSIILFTFAAKQVSSKYVLSDNAKVGEVSYTAKPNQLTINFNEYYTNSKISDAKTYKIRNNLTNKNKLKTFFNDDTAREITINGVKISKPSKIGEYDLITHAEIKDPYNVTLRYKENTTRTIQYIDDYDKSVIKEVKQKCYIGDNFSYNREDIAHYNYSKMEYSHQSQNTIFDNKLVENGKNISGKNMKNLNIKLYYTIKQFNIDINPDSNKHGINYPAGARVRSYNVEIYNNKNSLVRKIANVSDFNEAVPYGGYIKVTSIAYRSGYKYKNIALSAGSAGVISNKSATGFTFKQEKEGTNVLTIDTDPISYTIKFDGNGANGGSTASMQMNYDSSKNLTPNGFTRNNYSFVNWNTKPDGTGTSYANKQLVKNLSSKDGQVITLYAIWKSVATYPVDVNPIIQGTTYNAGLDGFTFDVYANDQKVATNVIDFYKTYPQGTKIRVKANYREGYNITANGDNTYWVGTDTLNIFPTWYDNIAPNIDNGGYFKVLGESRAWNGSGWSNVANTYRVEVYFYDKGVGVDVNDNNNGIGMQFGSTYYYHNVNDYWSYYSDGSVNHSPSWLQDCGNGWYKLRTTFTACNINNSRWCNLDVKLHDRAGNNSHFKMSIDNGWLKGTNGHYDWHDEMESWGSFRVNSAKKNFFFDEEDIEPSLINEENKVEITNNSKENITNDITNDVTNNIKKEENKVENETNLVDNSNTLESPSNNISNNITYDTNTLENTTSSKNITLEEKDNKVKENNTSKDNKVNEESINSSKAKVNNFEASENLVSDDKSSEKENK